MQHVLHHQFEQLRINFRVGQLGTRDIINMTRRQNFIFEDDQGMTVRETTRLQLELIGC
jgi:hypothetical protein